MTADDSSGVPGEKIAVSPLGLLQLADANFPSGGFAFSNGLEGLAKLGHLQSLEDFRQYLHAALDQATSADMAFFNSAYWAGGVGEGGELELIGEEWDAWVFLPTLRRAGLSQGQSWCRSMEEVYATPAIVRMRADFQFRKIPMHFLLVLAVSLRRLELPLDQAQRVFLHMALRDPLSAAVRLGLLGSLQAQKLHRESLPIAEAFAREHCDLRFDQALRSAPMIELAQASHENLYSKLFQS